MLLFLTGLNQAAKGTASQGPSEGQEDGQKELPPFDQLATKLGLPTNCDIDLRKQEELEVTDKYLCLADIFIWLLMRVLVGKIHSSPPVRKCMKNL